MTESRRLTKGRGNATHNAKKDGWNAQFQMAVRELQAACLAVLQTAASRAVTDRSWLHCTQDLHNKQQSYSRKKVASDCDKNY